MSAKELKSTVEVNRILAAHEQCASDRDTLAKMLRTTELRRDILKSRLERIRRTRMNRKKFSRKVRDRFQLLENLNGIIKLLVKALNTHKSILAAARGKKRRHALADALNFLRNQITKLQGKWHILEQWYKDARRILADIMENAIALQQFAQ